MGMVERIRVSVTCTASAAQYDTYIRGGYFVAVRYATASGSPFATGATVYFRAAGGSSGGATGFASGPAHDILKMTNTSVPNIMFPRAEPWSTAGATIGGASVGTIRYPLAQEQLRINVEGGGASGRGIFDLYVEGSV
mgnify:CR=1 FL=1